MYKTSFSSNSSKNELKKSKNKNRRHKKNKETNDSSVVKSNNSEVPQMCCTDSSCSASVGHSLQPDGAIGGQTEPTGDPNEMNAWTYNKLQDIKKAVEMLNLYQGSGPAKTPEDALKKRYDFWETQPVPKLDETPDSNEPIEGPKNKEQIKKDSLNLPIGFVWDTLDINDEGIVSHQHF